MRRYEEHKKALMEVYDDVDLSVLRAAQVVGMTTSGVADKQTLIAALAPKVFNKYMQKYEKINILLRRIGLVLPSLYCGK